MKAMNSFVYQNKYNKDMDPKYRQMIINMLGDKGKTWLEQIPGLIKEYEQKWNLKVFEPFPLSYNYVARAILDNKTPVVLKIGLPGDRPDWIHKEFKSEVEALKLFNGQGSVKLLKEDGQVILLEQAIPGIPLSALENEEQEIQIACQIMKKLWQPVPANPGNLILISEWHKGFAKLRNKFGGKTGPLPENLVKQAEELFEELTKTAKEIKVLHGDLHHDNILASKRDEYLAIDPKGVFGDPAYELGAFLHNPERRLEKSQNLKAILQKRIELLSKQLGFEKERVRGWGIYHTVLATWWRLENHGKVSNYLLNIAQTLQQISV